CNAFLYGVVPPARLPGKYWNVTKRLLTSAPQTFSPTSPCAYGRDIKLQGRVGNHRAEASGARGRSSEQYVRAGRSVEKLPEIRLRDGDRRAWPGIERIHDRRRSLGAAQPVLARRRFGGAQPGFRAAEETPGVL